MIIKIGSFNLISDKSEDIYLNGFGLDQIFNNFYMTGKEKTLYVSSKERFDNPKLSRTFEQDLLKEYDEIINYHELIRNKINAFVKEKTMKLYMSNNYSRYDLYNNIDLDKITMFKDKSQCSLNYYVKINNKNQLVYDLDNGCNLCFNPYSQEIENLEELYLKGMFNTAIKNSLILLELQQNKAPQFVNLILKINDFLKDKQTVNVIFKNGYKCKVNARIKDIFYMRRNEIDLNMRTTYGLSDIAKLVFNRTELNIDSNIFFDIKEQIIKTPADMLSFKIDEMKEELFQDFRNYEIEENFNMPSTIETCISILKNNDKNQSYPVWYSEKFNELWNQYNRIKILENASSIEDIKEIAVETGDTDLQKIYYILEGEESEEESEEI